MKPSLTLIFFLFLFPVLSQTKFRKGEFNLIFYNLENLFDTYDDPLINDNEFLPQGDRHWTKKRFHQKLAGTSKVILSSCNFSVPDIVGVCEVENRFVLEELVENTPLKKFEYRIIHKDSPDARGIDVALLYRAERCIPLFFEYIPLKDDDGQLIRSREILYACFQLQPKDTIHVFFNHWPSRYGGLMETEAKRIVAAKNLLTKINQLKKRYHHPKVIIMGDFNDEPQSPSISKWLAAAKHDNPPIDGEIVNLSAQWKNKGTLKHQQSWAVFDQVMVSDYLLNDSHQWITKSSFAEIIEQDFLLEDDEKFQGKKLFRTYNGFKYHGGFSDHLPVRLKLTYSD
ncbi:endonuclease/exonuclease/phosphatase family protein [Sunxiuqinia sp. A32]|uniref:endonuclease/exonuclease/phosphatase family protein n=1 Tax=Sunxiuqinia sp. A32 TaxID=3461496 RepID=UPI004045AD71